MVSLPVFADSDYWKLTKIAVGALEEDKQYVIDLSCSGLSGTLLIIAGGDSTNGLNYAEDVPVGDSTIVLYAENVDQSNAISLFHTGEIAIDSVKVGLYSINPLCEIFQPANLYSNNTAFDDGFSLGYE